MKKNFGNFFVRLLKWLFVPLRGKMPFVTRVLRGAGNWPRNKMLDFYAAFCWWHGIAIGFVIGSLCGGLFMWGLAYGFLPTSNAWLPSSIILLVGIFLAVVARKQLSQLRNYQIGYYAELRVAEMLERLGRPDWHVFHGFNPKDKFGREWGDIDHIIVCPKGVFCVETKAFRKLPSEDKNKLTYTSGKPHGILRYPSGREIPSNPLPKLQEKTKMLHNQLTQNCGGLGYVARILVLPEWKVKREGADKWEFVCSELEEIEEFLDKSKVELNSEQIKKIADFLDGKLRESLEELH